MAVGRTRCTICLHSERGRIELLVAGGASQRSLCRKFDLSHRSLSRHWTNHVSAERKGQLVAGPVKVHQLAEKALELDLSVLDYLALIRNGLVSMLATAQEAHDVNGTALLSARLMECLRLEGQFSGQLTKATASVTNNTLILSSPLMADLQSMLVQRLAPYPEARDAVLQGLEDLSRQALALDRGGQGSLLEG